MVKPFLPDIIGAIVARVNDAFSARETDPFNVFFDKGIIQQVRRSVYQADGNFPLVWLVYKFDEVFGNNYAIGQEVDFQLILAMPTEVEYTQQEREDTSFKPRLLPIYEEVMKEIKRDKWFIVIGDNGIRHHRVLLPYWGMADVEGPGVDNLFKNKFIDAISINVNGLRVKRENCYGGGYSVSDTSGYSVSTKLLTFYDDIELIVNGGLDYDPIDGEDSVVIPFLLGKTYEVVQRLIGQLRRNRTAEIVPDLDHGGFALTGGLKFSLGDTYIIKIRPQYVPGS